MVMVERKPRTDRVREPLLCSTSSAEFEPVRSSSSCCWRYFSTSSFLVLASFDCLSLFSRPFQLVQSLQGKLFFKMTEVQQVQTQKFDPNTAQNLVEVGALHFDVEVSG